VVNPNLAWVILFSPLVAAFVIVLFMLKHPKVAAWTALFGILVSFAVSVNFFIASRIDHHALPIEAHFPWIKAGWVVIQFGFLLDPLSVLMLLIVSGVGSCIFLFSIGYMEGDDSYARYFASLSLFAFSMLGIVLSANFLQLFLFWELVAVSSYLLIGFWFEKPSAADAGNKAFIINRVADFGLLCGIIWIWKLSGLGTMNRTLDFTALSQVIPAAFHAGVIAGPEIFLAALLILCGVAGKSAQFPLYIWLPDAMEGPTPVSALIHAATMVAAGIYLLCRMFFLIELSHEALSVIAGIGALTALLAAVLAVVQTDIKKILAYSTVSQLGYMALALGLASWHAGMYHLTTHAFFKALLFLGSGAIIHALHTQDIWKMGGLLKPMPVTAITFLIGTLALCGIWPFSGFFSKDEILILAFEHAPVLFGVALFTAGLTAFYMARLCWIAIIGPDRSHGHAHPHDAPFVMKAPLVVLAILSAIAGFIGIPHYLGAHAEHHASPVPVISLLTAITGLALGTLLYGRLRTNEDPLKKIPAFLYETVVRKYYLDDAAALIGKLFSSVIAGILYIFDLRVLISGLVNGTARTTRLAGDVLRRAQTGQTQHYAALFVTGIVMILFASSFLGKF